VAVAAQPFVRCISSSWSIDGSTKAGSYTTSYKIHMI
jgi:hypothetical protein